MSIVKNLMLIGALCMANISSAAVATFAGGCFWCMEAAFDGVPGVKTVTSGYTGGFVEKPSYNQVAAGKTGHREAIQIEFDESMISYEKLLDIFWKNVDPTDGGGQFCDRGNQYTAAIFYHSAEQQEAAKSSFLKIRQQLGSNTVQLLNATRFWAAEEEHQHYHSKNPVRYKLYKFGCDRDKTLRTIWGQ